MPDADAWLKRRIRRLVRAHPDLVLEALLETPFWPDGLDVSAEYVRFGDDDQSFLRVVFSRDGDVWPNVFQLDMQMDPAWMSSPRYRTFFGGGESIRTRTAILVLAKAIATDNAERPQRRA